MNAPQEIAAVRKAAFEANKLSKKLHRQVGQAIGDFNMIEAGDKVMVSCSVCDMSARLAAQCSFIDRRENS